MHVIDQVLDPDNSIAKPDPETLSVPPGTSNVPPTSDMPTPTSATVTLIPNISSTAGSVSGSASTSPASFGSQASSEHKSSTNPLASGMAGGVVGLLLIIIGVWILRRRRRLGIQSGRRWQNVADGRVFRSCSTESFHKPELEVPAPLTSITSDLNLMKSHDRAETPGSAPLPEPSPVPSIPVILMTETSALEPRGELDDSTIHTTSGTSDPGNSSHAVTMVRATPMFVSAQTALQEQEKKKLALQNSRIGRA